MAGMNSKRRLKKMGYKINGEIGLTGFEGTLTVPRPKLTWRERQFLKRKGLWDQIKKERQEVFQMAKREVLGEE